MKTVKIYIETTITGPAAPKRGGYAAALTFTRRNGDIEDRFLKGEEEGTTYNRSVLLAMILKTAFNAKARLDDRITKAAGLTPPLYISIPGKAQIKEIVRGYYLGEKK